MTLRLDILSMAVRCCPVPMTGLLICIAYTVGYTSKVRDTARYKTGVLFCITNVFPSHRNRMYISSSSLMTTTIRLLPHSQIYLLRALLASCVTCLLLFIPGPQILGLESFLFPYWFSLGLFWFTTFSCKS